jgi:hypothetical protein
MSMSTPLWQFWTDWTVNADALTSGLTCSLRSVR